MLLSDDEIKATVLIRNAADAQYRGTSYDVRVGRIYPPFGEERPPKGQMPGPVDEYLIPPRGVVEVVSLESFRLPDDVTGYATVKTGLCNDGILAINIGLVDPGYDNHVSSKLINFSKADFLLQKGDTFLRLSFHKHGKPSRLPAPNRPTEDYMRERRAKVLLLAETFLDLPSLTQTVSKKALSEWRSGLLKFVALGAFILTITIGITNLALGYFFSKWVPTPPSWASQRELLEPLAQRLDKLEHRLDALEKDRAAQTDATKPGSPNSAPSTAEPKGTQADGTRKKRARVREP
jgi:deoxycytidine triphosphate deaminase